MDRKKKIKTIIIEKYKYDGDDYLKLDPALLLKLLEFANDPAVTDDHLHAVVAAMQGMAATDDDWCFDTTDYDTIITAAKTATSAVAAAGAAAATSPVTTV